jgi:hypothetical protein
MLAVTGASVLRTLMVDRLLPAVVGSEACPMLLNGVPIWALIVYYVGSGVGTFLSGVAALIFRGRRLPSISLIGFIVLLCVGVLGYLFNWYAIDVGEHLAVPAPLASGQAASVTITLDHVIVDRPNRRMSWFYTFKNAGTAPCAYIKLQSATLVDGSGHKTAFTHQPDALHTLASGQSTSLSVVYRLLPERGITYAMAPVLDLRGCSVTTDESLAHVRYGSLSVTFADPLTFTLP